MVDREQRLIGGTFVSEQPFRRYNLWTGEEFLLRFTVSPDAVDTARVDQGVARLLSEHDWDRKLGGITGVTFEAGQKMSFTARVSRREEGDQLLDDIEDFGLGVSVGGHVLEAEIEQEAVREFGADGELINFEPAIVRATRWQIQEISEVSVPAIYDVAGNPAEPSSAFQPSQEDSTLFAKASAQDESYPIGGGIWIKASAFPQEFLTKSRDGPKSLQASAPQIPKTTPSMNLEQLQTENQKLTEELGTVKASAQELSQQLATAQAQNAELSRALAVANAKLKTLDAEVKATQHKAKVGQAFAKVTVSANELLSSNKITAAEKAAIVGTDPEAKLENLLSDEDWQTQIAVASAKLEVYAGRESLLRPASQVTAAEKVSAPATEGKTGLFEASNSLVAKAVQQLSASPIF